MQIRMQSQEYWAPEPGFLLRVLVCYYYTWNFALRYEFYVHCLLSRDLSPLCFMHYSQCLRTGCPPPSLVGWSFSSHSSFCIPNTVISDRLLTPSQALPSDIKWQHPNTWGNKKKTYTCELLPKPDYSSGVHLWACHLMQWLIYLTVCPVTQQVIQPGLYHTCWWLCVYHLMS